MKKTARKLSLHRETLRTLETRELPQIAAAAGTLLPSCNGVCDITFTCPDLTRTC